MDGEDTHEHQADEGVPAIGSAEDAYLLVWDTHEDTAEVYSVAEAVELDQERYQPAFVFDERSVAEDYAADYEPQG